MYKVIEVDMFISENILHSQVWDSADDVMKNKAVNQAERTLLRTLPQYYAEAVPIEDIAEQCIWILKIDDMIQRTELGATYISVDGISISYSNIDRTLCPFIMQKFNLSKGWNSGRKVARYSTKLSDSNRKGW